MSWTDAKRETLATWGRIRDALPERDEAHLLTEINAICSACNQARADQPERLDQCPACIFYQEFGGCRQINGDMGEAIVQGDWDRLEKLVDRFIAQVEATPVPDA